MNAPVRRVLRVACSVEHAFAVFTDRIDLWWPQGHRRLERSRLTLEAREGGRFFERGDGGEEAELGRVLAWEPPHRLACAWNLGTSARNPSRVEVRFIAEGASTRVEVVHSQGRSALGEGWSAKARLYAAAWEQVCLAYQRFIETEEGERHEP